ncbi:MAG: lactate racemase domain-containing protein [Anaerolineae bacterium]
MQLVEQTQSLDFPAALPETLLVVEQRFDAPQVEDVAAAAQKALVESGLLARMTPGATVAVGVGSRGIANLPVIVRAVVERLRQTGCKPFIIPAMGSHGGATVEGQQALLAELGVTADSVDAEIRASMEVAQIGQIPAGPLLFQDVMSAAADHTLLLGRVKPHTDFRGQLESGLAKMALIGLGKQRGAAVMHTWGVPGFQRFLAPAAPYMRRIVI